MFASNELTKNLARAAVPRGVVEYFDSLQARIRALETVVDMMLESPVYKPDESVGFNGQRLRKKIFMNLWTDVGFDAIAETGTWIGNTTAFMSENTHVPVHTSELNGRYHVFAKNRLRSIKDPIDYFLGDSRAFLNLLAEGPLRAKRVFFYLDAHWYHDLPLRDELQIIFDHWTSFIVMVDDFKVPGDDGYAFDSYHAGRSLEMSFIGSMLAHAGVEAFYPAAPSSEETGAKAGCVVLGRGTEVVPRVKRLA